MRQLGVLIWNSRERSGLLISVMLISTEMATGVLGMEFYQEKGRRLGLLVRASLVPSGIGSARQGLGRGTPWTPGL